MALPWAPLLCPCFPGNVETRTGPSTPVASVVLSRGQDQLELLTVLCLMCPCLHQGHGVGLCSHQCPSKPLLHREQRGRERGKEPWKTPLSAFIPLLGWQHLLASCSHCLGFSLARPGAVAALHEALVHPRYTQLREHVSLWESSCVYQWTGLSLKLTPGAAASEASEIPKYFGAVCAVQMSGVSGDKLCRFLPLPAILSHFHYLPFVEAVIYCILQPCNL